jgi:hypothetical protein
MYEKCNLMVGRRTFYFLTAFRAPAGGTRLIIVARQGRISFLSKGVR